MNRVDESVWDFLKGLLVSKKPEAKKKDLEHEIERLLEGVFKNLKLKYHVLKRQKGADGYLLRYLIDVDDQEYVAKSHLAYQTGYFSLCIWSRDEQDLLLVATAGYLDRNPGTLKAIARERLLKWLKHRN